MGKINEAARHKEQQKPGRQNYKLVTVITGVVTGLLILYLSDWDYSALLWGIPASVFVAFAINRFFEKRYRKQVLSTPFPVKWEKILKEKVPYYQNLPQEEQEAFKEKVQLFLEEKTITGVDTEVDDVSRVLVAASAVIPIFAFPQWEYNDLREVLIYSNAIDRNYRTEKGHILGMVGNRQLNHVVLLSKPALLHGFDNPHDKRNTAIHEFTHFIDKRDGAVDGVPEVLMKNQYVLPWLDLMHRKMQEIISKEKPDIDIYGATSQQEFFAVASEYFFEKPELLQKRHPDLYRLLEKIFHQDPAQRLKN